ncbi:hypothetical protein SADUNF_Sadunf04G0106600 [Salix dunnii]|uniref:DUF547 domain-containing protein n=1 Tax=Salix dunnii TaxID=1413687 RepID=A0A835KEE4_9ROSI|nr:hypothetical protein SADUNF_Sadunf04G0106600 [Salix dunnii]
MHEVKCRLGSTLKQFDFMEVRVSRHKHSNRARNGEEMVSVDGKQLIYFLYLNINIDADSCPHLYIIRPTDNFMPILSTFLARQIPAAASYTALAQVIIETMKYIFLFSQGMIIKSHKLVQVKLCLVVNFVSQKKMRQLEDGVEAKKRQSPNTELRTSLKQEILDLQDRLQDQVLVRRALEKALNLRPFSHDIMTDDSIPAPAKELIKEIAVLELKVVYLERYLLSLYRKTFEEQVLSLSTKDERGDERFKMSSNTHKGMCPSVPGNENDIMSDKDRSADNASHLTSLTKECNGTWGPAKLLDSSIHRCHSSMSQRSIGTSPITRLIARAVDSCHSLPLSMLELYRNDTSNAISLADHLGTSIRYDLLETPNWLSEEMIRRISTIFCELGGPPLINPDYVSSPISISSSPHEFSSQGHGDALSPQYGNYSSFNTSLDNPFHVGASKELSGPYCSMVKVQRLSRDTQKRRYIQHKLQDFRSLVSRLEGVNPRKMKHDEKLAFWINVHNALAMHAYIVYGIPQNNVKRMSLILKAAYNVGGQTVNVEMIQNSILGCRLLRPGPWLRQLFSCKTKFKNGDGRKAYSIDHPEPRLYFALCAGSYSDPAVRAYTPKRVYEDLEAAKEEYIQSTFIVNKEKKLLLSKIVESFAKDLELCPAGLVEMIEHLLPDYLKKRIQECQYRKFGKKIEWIPHNFSFRYLISKELA